MHLNILRLLLYLILQKKGVAGALFKQCIVIRCVTWFYVAEEAARVTAAVKKAAEEDAARTASEEAARIVAETKEAPGIESPLRLLPWRPPFWHKTRRE